MHAGAEADTSSHIWTASAVMGVPIPMALLLLALSPAGAQQANSTASWMTKRTGMITAALGTDGTLPQRSTPDHIVEGVAPGVNKIVWDLTDKRFFEITSSVFYAPKSGDPSKHSNCRCHGPPGSLLQAKCAPGCNSTMPYDDTAAKQDPLEQADPRYNWWDLYNVSTFFHDLGYDVFILSMPLKGINLGPGSQPDKINSDHWWFEQWERKGDHPIRYFLEPCFLTANYALNVLGYEDLYMAGLSGGGWTTTMASAMDPRIRISFPIAGSVPQDMRDPYVKTWPVGNDAEDYEQSAALNPAPPGHPAQPGRPFYTTCNYTCAYLLAGLERGRAQVQILHENDSCCFATHGRHDQMLAYERNVRAELGAADRTTSASHGWFTCTADLHDKHEVSHKDKRIIASVMQHGGASPGWRPAASAWDEVPCDIIHGQGGDKCPEKYPPL